MAHSAARNKTVSARRVAQRTHAFRRVAERYDTWLCGEDLQSLIDLIQTNRARLVERQSGTRGIYAVEFEGTRYYLVYDKTTKEIATFLSPEQGRAHELPTLLDGVDGLQKIYRDTDPAPPPDFNTEEEE